MEIDLKLAKITYNYLLSENNKFSEKIYFSKFDRQQIAEEYGNNLPRGFAQPEKSMLVSVILNPIFNNTFYVDGTDLVKGDKTIVSDVFNKNWFDINKK